MPPQYTRTENAIGYACCVLFVLLLPWAFRGVVYLLTGYITYWSWVWKE